MKNDLLLQGLFESALFNPAFLRPVDRLCVVSGYASAAMGFHHLQSLKEHEKGVKVSLIYGMTKADGLPKTEWAGFKELAAKSFPGQFKCAYLREGEPVHAKVYVWLQGNTPIQAFTGSANYTQNAFLNSSRREVLTECDPKRAFDFYKSLLPDCIDCCDPHVANVFSIGFRKAGKQIDGRQVGPFTYQTKANPISIVTDASSEFCGLQTASISLIDRNGQVPARSGLNWGQRPELSREPNQAYLSVRGDLRMSDFFPPIGVHFTVLCDDGTIMEMTRAQAQGKGLQTPHDNSEIGRYFRKRLGVPEGSFVRAEDIARYGRSTIDFYKIDSENYYMDFKRPSVNEAQMPMAAEEVTSFGS